MVLNSRVRKNAGSKLAAHEARTQVKKKAADGQNRWRERLAHHRTPISRSTVLRLIRTAGDHLAARSRSLVLTLAVVMTALIGLVDFATGSEIALSLFYLFPIAFVTWRLGRSAGFVLSCASAAVWLTADWAAGHPYSSAAIPYWNAGVRLVILLIVSYILAELSALLECVQTDYLTGLANTRGFVDLANREFRRCERLQKGLSIAYLDIDNFKQVNDSFGHAGGDSVLRLFGSTLLQTTRRSDIVARVGGDEFTILLVDTDESCARDVVKKIEKRLRAELMRCELPVTFTMGLATFDRVPESVEQAMGTADGLMYEAKRKGKNSVNHGTFAVQPEGAQ